MRSSIYFLLLSCRGLQVFWRKKKQFLRFHCDFTGSKWPLALSGKYFFFFFFFLRFCYFFFPALSAVMMPLCRWQPVFRFFLTLTAHNWQKWKRVFLTCPCHKIYRDEGVGLKKVANILEKLRYLWKCEIWGNILKIWYFVNNCFIKARI